MNLPVKYLDADGKSTVVAEDWPIIDIHDTMSYLFNEAGIEISSSNLRTFWEHSKTFGEPWAEQVSSAEMESLIPIGFYGDSARVDMQNYTSVHVLSFFCDIILWKPKSVRWSRFLVMSIEEERLTSGTIPAILRRVAWSLNHCFAGRYPEEGHLGQPLSGKALRLAGQPLCANGLRFQCVELRGDWSYQKKLWRFANRTRWSGENVCHLCNAKGISQSWEDVYWNVESASHTDFSLIEFLNNRIPARQV